MAAEQSVLQLLDEDADAGRVVKLDVMVAVASGDYFAGDNLNVRVHFSDFGHH